MNYNTILKNKYLVPVAICFVCICTAVYVFFFSSLIRQDDTYYLYIDNDDTCDSIFAKLEPNAKLFPMMGLKNLARHTSYENHIKTGRYAIKSGEGSLIVYRHLKNGLQSPVRLTIPSVRTIDRLAGEMSRKLMPDSTEFIEKLTDMDTCAKYGYDTATIVCMFIPETYEVYWNMSVDGFMDRMKKESDRFWNDSRKEKAERLQLSPEEVITLASIVDEETANNDEKPMIAGMYYNRLMLKNESNPKGMPLQADPTVKFALKQFELKRIYHNMLNTDSPYNTYKYAGLPPGPIRIPTVAGIDAVLNLVHHDYLYMCAKEDFSGKHNFASTYQEHLANASKYSKALNERGIN